MPLRRRFWARPTPPAALTGATAVNGRDEHRDDGVFPAMDQIANWVRFADAKSAVLAAALGVVLTAFLNGLERLVVVIRGGGPCAWITGALIIFALAAFGYTLTWLFRSLVPRRRSAQPGINRFAWPTLGEVSPATLLDHVGEVEARIEAWQQVMDLSAVANEKFKAFDLALRGFATCFISVVVLVGFGIAMVP